MSSARLLVVEGPDVGADLEVPPAGGGIGRDQGNAVRLNDRSVSRAHCAIERRGEAHVLVEPSGGKGVRVNGRAVTEHPLADGDEIALGRTRLVYLRGERREPVRRAAATITLELPAAALLSGE